MSRRFALVAVLLLVLPEAAFADFSGRVVRVTDGDTVSVLVDRQEVRVRLEGIDAPELGQAYGRAAKRYVSDAVFGKDVLVVEHGTDRYGRTLGEVMTPAGESLNRLLVRDGFAWWFRRYSKDATLGALEADARKRGVGLWTDPAPVPPWEFRRQKREGTQ